MFHLAKSILRIVAAELDYPDDLLVWYEISEMIDRLQYDNVPLGFNEKDVISKIKNAAISFLRLDV
ncbi:hypothetical protein BKP37_02075 [Anaerobacillus alkalilacustris]|uniref:Uncharacterized protein n=1 Tax=Anaerobacillus alkalilacustris TaxID=393763 RepID=A0A1S2LYA2_9BACI|nr:hypothetical protein [Anaerobacillus alkalilacustris]OIJ17316.1 hypothetical protein BKP37_02075 [Anaerobacillus alkalilacustris]